MIRINQVKLPMKHEQEELLLKVAKMLKLGKEEIHSLQIVKQSIDARKKDAILCIYSVDVAVDGEIALVKRLKNVNIIVKEEVSYQFPVLGELPMSQKPVIIGCGPAGLFCALMLARHGYSPILLERGEAVESRTEQVALFWSEGILKPNSNVQFGEGGAGTFSDGKLNTLVKDPQKRNQKVLEILVEFGADSSILYESKPHIGTDVLSVIVKRMREEILRLNGSVRFTSQVTDFVIEENKLTGLMIGESELLKTEAVVLAIGHSARDTFEQLYKRKVPMQQKSFAVGVRIQHPQRMINESQYGIGAGHLLGPATYKLTKQATTKRGVYTFCMCPGGYVVNASSEDSRLAINGMSNHNRDGETANSAIIVTVTPEDYPDASPLAGVNYQRKLEELAYQYGNAQIPIQLYGDFKSGTVSTDFGDVQPEFKGGYSWANLNEMLPSYLTQSLIEGIDDFSNRIKGFDRPDAILAGVESRTSSPIRIDRDSHFESLIKGLFPCGEGAGYAGGITSAAMDGIKVAEEIARRYRP